MLRTQKSYTQKSYTESTEESQSARRRIKSTILLLLTAFEARLRENQKTYQVPGLAVAIVDADDTQPLWLVRPQRELSLSNLSGDTYIVNAGPLLGTQVTFTATAFTFTDTQGETMDVVTRTATS